MTGNNGVGISRPLPECRFLQVEAQTAFAHLRVGPVAAKAVAGQNRLHVLVEIELLRSTNGAHASMIFMASECRTEQNSEKTKPRHGSDRSQLGSNGHL